MREVSASIAVSRAEFTACWDALGLDLPPAQLTGVGPGNGFDRRAGRAALAALADDELEAHGVTRLNTRLLVATCQGMRAGSSATPSRRPTGLVGRQGSSGYTWPMPDGSSGSARPAP